MSMSRGPHHVLVSLDLYVICPLHFSGVGSVRALLGARAGAQRAVLNAFSLPASRWGYESPCPATTGGRWHPPEPRPVLQSRALAASSAWLR